MKIFVVMLVALLPLGALSAECEISEEQASITLEMVSPFFMQMNDWNMVAVGACGMKKNACCITIGFATDEAASNVKKVFVEDFSLHGMSVEITSGEISSSIVSVIK